MPSNLNHPWSLVFWKTKFSIDDPYFWYFTSFTTYLYVFCTCLLTFEMMSEDAISCEPISNASMSKQWIEYYCLATGTSTLVGDEIPLKHYHKYYGLVIFYLLAASVCWYLPKCLWAHLEDSKVSNMCSDIDNPQENMKMEKPYDEELRRKAKLVSLYAFTGDWHFSYAMKKFFCESLAMVMTAIIYYGTCKFLDNDYSLYGFTAIKYLTDPDKCNGHDAQFQEKYPIVWDYFPVVTNCSVPSSGRSGTPQATDVLCVLNYNKLSGYIFLILWINFIICAMLTGGLVIFRLASISSLRIRKILMTGKVAPTKSRYRLLNDLKYPQFLVLMEIRKHCNTRLFAYFMDELTLKFLGNEMNDIEEGLEDEQMSIGGDSMESFDSDIFKVLPDHCFKDSDDSGVQAVSDENSKCCSVCGGYKNPSLATDVSSGNEEDGSNDDEAEANPEPVAPIQIGQPKKEADSDISDEDDSIDSEEEKEIIEYRKIIAHVMNRTKKEFINDEEKDVVQKEPDFANLSQRGEDILNQG